MLFSSRVPKAAIFLKSVIYQSYANILIFRSKKSNKKISCCIIQSGDLIFYLKTLCYLLPSNTLNVSVWPLLDVTARTYIPEASPSIIRFSFPVLCRTVLPFMDIRSIFDTLSPVICMTSLQSLKEYLFTFFFLIPY